MGKICKQKLTLDQAIVYEIIVPGHLEAGWLDAVGEIRMETGSDDDDLPVSTLTGTFDQAALIGLLRRLYSLGLPLISVNWVDAQ